MIYNILEYPDPKLRRVGKEVTDVTETRIQDIIANMTKTLYNFPNCIGLAATQLDIEDPPSITVIDVSDTRNDLKVMINPKIVEASGSFRTREGCMSVYPLEVECTILRSKSVTVRYMDEKGKEHVEKVTGLLSHCVQHETDHLNGRLYIDCLSREAKKYLKKMYKKLKEKKK